MMSLDYRKIFFNEGIQNSRKILSNLKILWLESYLFKYKFREVFFKSINTVPRYYTPNIFYTWEIFKKFASYKIRKKIHLNWFLIKSNNFIKKLNLSSLISVFFNYYIWLYIYYLYMIIYYMMFGLWHMQRQSQKWLCLYKWTSRLKKIVSRLKKLYKNKRKRKLKLKNNLNDEINPDIKKNFAKTVVYKTQPKKLKF